MGAIISPAGNAITPGTTAVFNETITYGISVTSLSDTKALVTYNVKCYGIACVLDISGNTITPGTPAVFNEATTYHASVIALSTTKALVVYQDIDYYGITCVLDISGSTITTGAPVVFKSATIYNISAIALSPDKALVTFTDSENRGYGTACILNISGNTITTWAPVVFNKAYTFDISVTALSPTKALVTYRDTGNSYYGTACVLDISDTTITPGTPAVFNEARTDYISVTALSSTQALVTYTDSENRGYSTACILNISGNTITPGIPVVFNETYAFNKSAIALSPTKAFATYQSDSYLGTACVLDISGNIITQCTPVVFNEATIYYISVTALPPNKALVSYRDVGNNNYGTACVLNIAGEA